MQKMLDGEWENMSDMFYDRENIHNNSQQWHELLNNFSFLIYTKQNNAVQWKTNKQF